MPLSNSCATSASALISTANASASSTVRAQANSPYRAILRPPLAADYIGLSVSTLAKRRLRGERPHFVRLGPKAVGYHVAELDDWLLKCRRHSTSTNIEPGEEATSKETDTPPALSTARTTERFPQR